MDEDSARAEFERVVLPHLDAAYNLARWLTRDETAAEDMVQEAFVRALRYFRGFRGENARAWVLTIVRNTCFSGLAKKPENAVPLDEELGGPDAERLDPAALLAREQDGERVRRALEALPLEFREAIVLRELEGLSYREIAEVAGVPIGTVMSRLARARKRLETSLSAATEER